MSSSGIDPFVVYRNCTFMVVIPDFMMLFKMLGCRVGYIYNIECFLHIFFEKELVFFSK